jgi:photosystem II stability/assembly factor-like uncharacterized protein
MILASLIAAAAIALGPQTPYTPLAFVDPSHGWLATRTAILGTVDGGRTWRREASNAVDQLAATDSTHAWAIVDQGGFLRTIDGRHWQNLGVKRLVAISFVDRRRGFALQRDGILLRTTDGGRFWQSSAGAPTAQALCFSDSSRGWLARGGTVYSTDDGGASWRSTRLHPGRQGYPIPALGCRANDVWAVLHEGAGAGTEGYEVYRSLDGGRTWREVLATPWQRRLPSISNYAGAFDVLGRGGAVLSGSCSPCRARGTVTIVSTADGGRTFSRLTIPGQSLRGISFPDPSHGWLFLDGRVRRLR